MPSDRRFWVTALLLVAGFVALGLPFGPGVVALTWMAIGALVQALVFGVVYRSRLRSPTWSPQTSGDIGWLLMSALVGAFVGGLMGAYPGSWTMGYPMLPGLLWWSIRSGVYLFIGTLVTVWLRFWDRPARRLRPRGRLGRAALGLSMLTCCYLSFAYPAQPMTWLPLVPALHAGMILTAWGATVYGMLQGMADAVLLISPQGRITWHNAAARALSGRPILGDAVAPWAPYFRSPSAVPSDDEGSPAGPARDGSAAARDIVAYLLHQRPGDPIRRAEMRLPADAGIERILSVRSRHLRTPEGDRILLLAQDITAEHARAEQLKGFAGRVAHDLRGPLTGLSGWMEAAQGALQDGDADASLTAVTRGRAAIRRLATMIDDWLAYTVTREGVLRPVDLRLQDLVREATELYDERARPSQPASFELDVSHRVQADRSLRKVLLANLIGNAVKYSRPGEPPRVTVTSRDAPSIVVRHGGWISARTNAAGGATFTLTLPAARRLGTPSRPGQLRQVA